MFTFGFSLDDDNDTNNKAELQWEPANEVTVPNNTIVREKNSVINFNVADCCLKLLPFEEVIKYLPKENCIVKAENLNSDLVSSKYEGGLKVWECTEDLVRYLLQHKMFDNMVGKIVLDMGCGAGVLGILALQHDATLVHFQDYNEEVLRYLTHPNILLNKTQHQKGSYRFFSGDWASFADLDSSICKESYDLILTCETIYNPDCHKKLLTVFKKKLKKYGVIYLAAKTYYFGVGGGLRQFEEMLKRDATFQCVVLWKCTEGVQREILKIKRIQ